MPPNRTAIGRYTTQAKRKKTSRASETDEQRQLRMETVRIRSAQNIKFNTNLTEQQLIKEFCYVLPTQINKNV